MPALLETTVKPFNSGLSRRALMSVLGTPEKPNPPTRSVESPFTSLTASAAEGTTLSIALWAEDAEKFRRHMGLNSGLIFAFILSTATC